MHVCDAYIVNLCQEVPNVFMGGPSVIVVEP
jgi:hypothetical protein